MDDPEGCGKTRRSAQGKEIAGAAAVLAQWERTVKNWIAFHNSFTRDNITLMLTLREYHMAQLAARRVPYAQIAERFNISVGRLKNIMLEIYEKLCVSGRDELAKYVVVQTNSSTENDKNG